MSNQENRFRTVAFGGFHKQDVLNYITSASKDYQDQSIDLKQKVDSLQQERDVFAEKYEAAEAARKKNASDLERLSETLTERTNALEQTERKLSALKEEYEKVAVRLTELEGEWPRLQADAEAYAALKDHTATIELEAHRKAQETVDQAQAQAAKIRNELESWLRRVQNSYQHLRTDMTATVTQLTGELERGIKALNEVPEAFRQHDDALAALLECERMSTGPKAPEPLPLDGEECNG